MYSQCTVEDVIYKGEWQRYVQSLATGTSIKWADLKVLADLQFQVIGVVNDIDLFEKSICQAGLPPAGRIIEASTGSHLEISGVCDKRRICDVDSH